VEIWGWLLFFFTSPPLSDWLALAALARERKGERGIELAGAGALARGRKRGTEEDNINKNRKLARAAALARSLARKRK